MRILIVDDEEVALTSVRRLLRRHGLSDVEICSDGRKAIEWIKEEEFDIILLDLLMPGIDGIQVLEAAKPYRPNTEFIIITAVEDTTTAFKTLRLGAYDYLVKPVENERLFLSLERAYEKKGLSAGLAGTGSGSGVVKDIGYFSKIVTQSPRIKELLNYAAIMARSGNSILITGESGTGKELLAQGIHQIDSSKNGPFIAVNVSSVPETLFESQFFGHLKGAFTGAERNHSGFFEQANGGTLFLDEIGELPVSRQVKLLRALEEKTVIRIGDTRPISSDVRILSATNDDLDKACQEGRFRLDLLYRLKAAHIHLPPLRERDGDIPLLANCFLKRAALRYKKAVTKISVEALEVLIRKKYLGNIRELAQLIENAVLLSTSAVILPEHLGAEVIHTPIFARTLCTLRENNFAHMAYVLKHTMGDRKQAAEILGVTVRQVQRKINQMKEIPRWFDIMKDLLKRF